MRALSHTYINGGMTPSNIGENGKGTNREKKNSKFSDHSFQDFFCDWQQPYFAKNHLFQKDFATTQRSIKQ